MKGKVVVQIRLGTITDRVHVGVIDGTVSGKNCRSVRWTSSSRRGRRRALRFNKFRESKREKGLANTEGFSQKLDVYLQVGASDETGKVYEDGRAT